ncbi:MAG: DUF3793 family protein [Lachnospiraceae bacterium]|nr:DUF3793 family protein [Lachnospiraceae bacterium]
MPDRVLIRQCSPTLTGIKAGNLYPYRYRSRSALYREIRELNRRLAGSGVITIPLKCGGGFALLYTYRPGFLGKCLSDPGARRILESLGYTDGDVQHMIAQLVERFRDYSEFPHEVGLFLGYPPEDVKGFMTNKGGNCKYTGCWKAYGDAVTAELSFKKYTLCCKRCEDLYDNGMTVEQLTVSIA